jgi:hypothetical protein
MSVDDADAMRRNGVNVSGLAAIVGLAIALIAFDWSFLDGTGPLWAWPTGDRAAYLTPILYFVRYPWRLPLFALPEMGYPEGGSVIFNDAIPIGALVSKILYAISGHVVNHVGWWVLISYPLQAVMGVRLVRALLGEQREQREQRERTPWLAFCIGLWPLLSIPFLWRFGHTALTNQFLILWALALYFEQMSAKRVFVIEQTLLLIVGLLINPYLWVMTILLLAASWLALLKEGVLQWRDVLKGVGVAVVVLSAAWVSGHFAAPVRQLTAFTDGRSSWNAASLIVPRPAGVWAHVTDHVTRYLPTGQYEGESYLGFGPLVLLVACLLTRPRAIARAAARHWPLLAILGACVVFAASHRVYVSSYLLVAYPLPPGLETLAGMLRMQGRFIWPVVYLLMLAPAVLLLRAPSRTPGLRAGSGSVAAAVLIATATQVVEAVPIIGWSRVWSAQATRPLFDTETMTRWMGAHQRVWQYPSFWCGGVNPVHERDDPSMTRQVQMQVLAARVGIPNNSVYMSRALKDCAKEGEWAEHPTLEPGVLYIFLTETPDFSPAVSGLIQGSSCRDLGWGTACSRQPLD